MNWIDKLEAFWIRWSWLRTLWRWSWTYRDKQERERFGISYVGPMAWPRLEVVTGDCEKDLYLDFAFPLLGSWTFTIYRGLVKRFPWLRREGYLNDRVFGFYSCASHILFYWNGSNYGSGGPDSGHQYFFGWDRLVGKRTMDTTPWEQHATWTASIPATRHLPAQHLDMVMYRRYVIHSFTMAPTCRWVQWEARPADPDNPPMVYSYEDGIYPMPTYTVGGVETWGEAADKWIMDVQKERR